jgi:hypothetical protein
MPLFYETFCLKVSRKFSEFGSVISVIGIFKKKLRSAMELFLDERDLPRSFGVDPVHARGIRFAISPWRKPLFAARNARANLFRLASMRRHWSAVSHRRRQG